MDVEDLVDALTDYIESAAEEKAAREKYDGYEWGYHGYSLIAAKRKAADAFGERLNAYVDARIAAATAGRESGVTNANN